jgi:hypothetical protein
MFTPCHGPCFEHPKTNEVAKFGKTSEIAGESIERKSTVSSADRPCAAQRRSEAPSGTSVVTSRRWRSGTAPALLENLASCIHQNGKFQFYTSRRTASCAAMKEKT